MLEITKVRKDDSSGLDKPENAELKALWEKSHAFKVFLCLYCAQMPLCTENVIVLGRC